MPDLTLPVAFITALEALTNWLDAEHVPYTTIGGVAVSLLAQPQQNLDFPYIRRWTKEFAAVLEMPKLLDDLERMLPRS